MVSKLISAITFSKKRENLLLLLRDGPRTLEEIRNSLNVTSSGMIPQIRKLEEPRLVRQEGKKYLLTDTGTVIAEVFSSFIRTAEIIENYSDFWELHDIKAIPLHLLKRIYELGDCRLIETKISEIYEPHKEWLEVISKSKKMMGISPVFHHSYPPLFLQLAQSGVEVSLILTRDVFNKIKNEHMGTLQKFLGIRTVHLYVSDENIRLASGVTDGFCSISLFFRDGGYDSLRDLVSFDQSAVKWGEELFRHFLLNSKEIKSL